MFYLLKRFKGGITYSEFYEAWDDDIWALYNKDITLAKKEAEDTPNTDYNSGDPKIKKIPEPHAPEEDEEMLAMIREFRD